MKTEETPTVTTSHLFSSDTGPIQQRPRDGSEDSQRSDDGPTVWIPESLSFLATRAATDSEASGRRVLIRAATTAGFGGLVIALTSMAFGPRFLASDVRVLGILVGLTMFGLALVAPLHPKSNKAGLGVLIVAGAIAAFPIAAGGYFIGSLVGVIGGSLLIAYEPPPKLVVVAVHRAGRIRRVTGLLVDFLVAFALQRLLYTLLPTFFNESINVYLSWVLCWLVAAVAPTIATRRTAGRILVVLRVAERSSGDRALVIPTLVRELLRGTIAIGSFFAIARSAIGNEFRLLPALIAIAIVFVVGFLGEQFQLMDRLTNTTSVYDNIIAAKRSPDSD